MTVQNGLCLLDGVIVIFAGNLLRRLTDVAIVVQDVDAITVHFLFPFSVGNSINF